MANLSGGESARSFCLPAASPSGARAVMPSFVYLPGRVFKLSYSVSWSLVHTTTFYRVWLSFIFDPGFASNFFTWQKQMCFEKHATQ